MSKQVKSKQRVADHGEVFTAEREVESMLDLVKAETERIDSRFLEPACGDGNFLAKVLERKLSVVKKQYKKLASDYEKYSILALTSIYGIDILLDNTKQCQERLYKIWEKEYNKICKDEINDDVKKSAKYILQLNIVCGNALSMMCVDTNQEDTQDPIVFPEWAFVSQDMLKRRDYRFDVLLEAEPEKEEIEMKFGSSNESYDTKSTSMQYGLFGVTESVNDSQYWMTDPETNETVPKPINEFKPTDYRRIWDNE